MQPRDAFSFHLIRRIFRTAPQRKCGLFVLKSLRVFWMAILEGPRGQRLAASLPRVSDPLQERAPQQGRWGASVSDQPRRILEWSQRSALGFPSDQFIDGDAQRLRDARHRLDGGVGCVA
jgi:hypothetical protein